MEGIQTYKKKDKLHWDFTISQLNTETNGPEPYEDKWARFD